MLKKIIKKIFDPDKPQNNLERNVGEKVIEWPERIELAFTGLNKYIDTDINYNIADYGSGQQTLKRFLKPGWKYTPFDFYKRTEDTVLINFNDKLPETDFDIIFCLGVFEYLDSPFGLLENIIKHSKFAVISYTAFTSIETRQKNGWRNNLTLEEIENKIKELDSECLEKIHYIKNQWVYIIKGKR